MGLLAIWNTCKQHALVISLLVFDETSATYGIKVCRGKVTTVAIQNMFAPKAHKGWLSQQNSITHKHICILACLSLSAAPLFPCFFVL